MCIFKINKIILIILFLSFNSFTELNAQSGLCTDITPFFQVDLTGNPNGTWVSDTAVARQGLCCGNTNPDVCIEFEILLDASAVAINFNIASGAVPGGSMYYQIDCSPPTPVGEPICLNGPGPYTLTFCKPGNNVNTYAITSYIGPYTGPDASTTDNCDIQLNVYGLDSTMISWNDITAGGLYNNFLSCTDCPSPIFTPHTPYPAYIDYKVCGLPITAKCTDSITWCDTVRVNLIPKLNVSIIPPGTASFCSNQGGIQLSAIVSGGAPPYTYIWINPSGTAVGFSNQYYATSSGTYTVEIRDTMYSHCGPQYASINVVSYPIPLVVVPQTSTICYGSNITITASGGSTYQWSNGSTSPSITVSPNSSITYSVTVTNTYGCTATENSDVFVNALPIINAGADQTICSGTNVILNATGGSSYTWSNGIQTASTTVSPTTTTSYSVTATDINGCSASDNVTVFVNPLPIADAGPDQSICLGQQSAILSASGGTSYNWSNGINSSSITVSPNTVTTYSVTATNNGCTASDNVTVFINPLPTITISPAQNICKGGTATLSASGGNTYNWSNGSTSSSITVYPASSTTYYVTVTNSYGCTATGSSVVYVNALPIANAGTDQTICSGANITLNASGGISYAWNIGDLTSSISVAPITTTSYTVTVTDINGCSASDDVTVLVNPIPIVNAGQDQTICQGQTAILGASGGSGYYWSNGSASSTIIVSPNTTTTYSVTVLY